MALTLPVTFCKQNRNGLCGAACAQMVVSSQTKFDTGSKQQDTLWEDIKALTTTPSNVTTGDPAGDDSPCESFPKKICEACRPQSFCWCAFPTTLKAIIRELAPATAVRVITSAKQKAITGKVLTCLRRGIAPVVLVSRATHWVVVNGFDEDSDHQVSLLNPAFDAQIAVSLDDWNVWYLDVGGCGIYKNKYVVVGNDAPKR
jgi:peptidase C39-like protein